ncbi:hypothetical protein ACQPZF_11930 [Actinosynnema sp. CS-041913]|uniref:hypothetical protein n=1 Tax=Actinosynnema sp. CS-041913 TaxID=3239917 RepID=UPI003D8E6E1D
MGNSVLDPAMSVDLADLGELGVRLGSGGEAAVYDLPGFRLPDVRGELVFKRYRVMHAQPEALRRVVAARTALPADLRARLDAMTAWPVRVVVSAAQAVGVSGAQAVGVLMPRIPAPFFDLVQRSAGERRVLREVQNLFVDEARALRVGRPAPTPEQRLRICRDFAAALAFLHDRMNIVFGDLNPKNEVFRLDAEPMVMFLDCDAVRPAGVVSRTRQLDSPDWVPPEGGVLSRATDQYKLGLFVLRCLTPGHFSSTGTDPAVAVGVLDAEGMDLLRRALGTDQRARPAAGDWVRYLRRVLGQAAAPPVLGEVRLDRAFVLSAQSVVVEWEAREARHVEVTAGARTTRVDGRPGRGTTSVVLERSGPIEVRALNDLGEDRREVGPVTVVPVPDVATLPVPLPQVPWPDQDPVGLLLPVPEPPWPAAVRSPLPLPAVGGHTVPLPPLPAPWLARFPLDLPAMLSESPALELDAGGTHRGRDGR